MKNGKFWGRLAGQNDFTRDASMIDLTRAKLATRYAAKNDSAQILIAALAGAAIALVYMIAGA